MLITKPYSCGNKLGYIYRTDKTTMVCLPLALQIISYSNNDNNDNVLLSVCCIYKMTFWVKRSLGDPSFIKKNKALDKANLTWLESLGLPLLIDTLFITFRLSFDASFSFLNPTSCLRKIGNIAMFWWLTSRSWHHNCRCTRDIYLLWGNTRPRCFKCYMCQAAKWYWLEFWGNK